MIVDFHVHSTASDGTHEPEALAAETARFAAVALTDHDNTDGVRAFLAAPRPDGATAHRLVGIELSIEPGAGFDQFHLLGLGIDPAHAGLTALLGRILESRKARNLRIRENFRKRGIDMGDEILSYAHGEVLARPHFARWLVDRGYSPDVKSAFATYLMLDSPDATRCFEEERWRPSQEEAFAAIHAAGGVTVMAHPKYWRRTWRETGPDAAVAERELARLKEMGLDGLEALYQANSPEENVLFTRLAHRLDFLKSAGSDFHGANKPAIALGMNVDDAFIAPLLERLQVRA